jgi:hypothetical protein
MTASVLFAVKTASLLPEYGTTFVTTVPISGDLASANVVVTGICVPVNNRTDLSSYDWSSTEPLDWASLVRQWAYPFLGSTWQIVDGELFVNLQWGGQNLQTVDTAMAYLTAYIPG